MSGLILPHSLQQHSMQPRRPIGRAGDYITLAEANLAILEAIGPLAQAFEEMKAKVSRLEDAAGITDESVRAQQVAQAQAGGDV